MGNARGNPPRSASLAWPVSRSSYDGAAVCSALRGIPAVSHASHSCYRRLSSPTAGQAIVATTLPVRPGAGTVLLVDDEPVVLRVARRTLTACGYRVLTASNVAEGRRLIADHASSIDLLLTDVRMPDGHRAGVAADVIDRNGAVRVLYMSGYAANELKDVFVPQRSACSSRSRLPSENCSMRSSARWR